MLAEILRNVFIIDAFFLAVSIIYGKLFLFKKKDAVIVANYCAFIAVFMGFYVLLSLLFVFLLPGILNKLIMTFFAVSPFILGLSADYRSEKYFALVQIVIIVLSIAYIW